MPAAESISGDAEKVRRVGISTQGSESVPRAQDQCLVLPDWGGERQGCKAEGDPRVMKEITDKNQQVFLYPHLTAAEGSSWVPSSPPKTVRVHHSTPTASLGDFSFLPSKAQTPNFIFKCKTRTQLFMQLKIRHHQIFKPLEKIFKGAS